MSNDRGTMQRGLTSRPQDQEIWPEATPPSSRRLPSARRERKPALAAFALLLIIGGALAAGLLVVQSGKRVAAIEISQPVGVGQRIPLSAMQPVQVASGTGLDYVPWDEASQVARFYAATTLPPGTLLTSAMVMRASGVTTGKDVLGLALKDGQLPGQLKVGDHVGIYAVSGQGSGNAGCPASGGAALTRDAVVVSMTTPAGSGAGPLVSGSPNGTIDVGVAVNPADSGAVACYASAGSVAVVLLPPVGAPAAAPPASPSPASPASPSPTGTG